MCPPFESSSVAETISTTPFIDNAAQRLFNKWSQMNDFVQTLFIPRKIWDQLDSNNGVKVGSDGKLTLILPEDLHLWEIGPIVGAIDKHTPRQQPELQNQRALEIFKLGQTLEKAGLYLREYLPDIDEGQSIAADLARDFYQYGLALQSASTVNQAKPFQLTEEEKQELDRWLLGEAAYQRRIKRLQNSSQPITFESKRKKLLKTYFAALSRSGYKETDVTKLGPIQHLQDRSREQITASIKSPERTLQIAIFSQGVEQLLTHLKVGDNKQEANAQFLTKQGIDTQQTIEVLHQRLRVQRAKTRLMQMRENEDAATVAQAELQMVNAIQRQTQQHYYFESGMNNPAAILESNRLNCLGATIVASGLLKELGIKHLAVKTEAHASLIITLDNNTAHWKDFTPQQYAPDSPFTHEVPEDSVTSFQITQDRLSSTNKLTNVLALASYNTHEYLKLEVRVPFRTEKNVRMKVFQPDTGLSLMLLYNSVQILRFEEEYDVAISACEYMIQLYPKIEEGYLLLGAIYNQTGQHIKSIELFKHALELNPQSFAALDSLT